MAGPGVKVQGLSQMNRSLGKVSKDFRRGVIAQLREIAKRVRIEARSDAPRVSGRLQRSLRATATSRGAAITSRLPYAGWVEFGGEIKPRGTPFSIEGRRFISASVDDNTRSIERDLGDLFDRIAREDFND